MQFTAALTLAFATLAIAAPTSRLSARALGTQTYDQLSISGGTAGDAEAEALAKLDVGTDFAAVSADDIAFLGDVNDIANDAETDAFNPAIEAATGDEATALTNGKIKNKVLKLMATVLELQAKAAQGEDTAAKLAAEQKKLDNNIALDKAAAGEPSTALTFDGTAGSGAASGAATKASTGAASKASGATATKASASAKAATKATKATKAKASAA